MGEEGNILEETAENCKILKVNNPILTCTDLLKIKNMKKPGFKVEVIPITYYKNTSLEKAIDRLFLEADRAHRDGANIIICLTGILTKIICLFHPCLPYLPFSSIWSRQRRGLPWRLYWKAESRERYTTLLPCWDMEPVPSTLSAQESIRSLIENGMLDKDYYAAVEDYNAAVLHGIVKIASKMGISTIQSYQGAQIFEAIGISKNVIDKYFTDTVSRVGGITLDDIANDVDVLHSAAFDPLGLDVDLTLDSVGSHKERAGRRNIYTILLPFTFCRKRQEQEAMRFSKNIPIP